MKTTALIFALLFSSLTLFSCKKENNPIPPEEQPQASLSLEDVSCTEAWIKLSTSNISLPANVDLYKDSSLTKTINLTTEDTVLYVDSLLPNHSYNLQAFIQSTNQSINSGSLTVSTMDTTSHDFTWQTWTFGGQAGSCVLRDVVIIDENNIWAVGEVYLLDSVGVPDPKAYNAVHWDGNEWKLKRIKTNACGGVEYPPINAIYAFSSDNILFAHIDGSISHFDGIEFTNNCSLISQLNGSANKIWGISRNDFYVVSGNGFIAHYQNGQWSRIASGTDLNINDIYGAFNNQTNRYEIIAPAANVLQSLDRDLLLINDNSVEHLNTSPITGTLRTVWFIPGKRYFLGGGGIFRKSSLADSLWESNHNGVTIYSTNRIRGNGSNDIALTGGFGEVLQFNGYDFKSYISQTQVNGNYYSIDIKDNIIAVVGEDGSKAAITIGVRTR